MSFVWNILFDVNYYPHLIGRLQSNPYRTSVFLSNITLSNLTKKKKKAIFFFFFFFFFF